jgi:hypothetical protein
MNQYTQYHETWYERLATGSYTTLIFFLPAMNKMDVGAVRADNVAFDEYATFFVALSLKHAAATWRPTVLLAMFNFQFVGDNCCEYSLKFCVETGHKYTYRSCMKNFIR